MNRFAEGKPIGTSKKFVATLDDERAMDLAGKFVSEGFVLAVSNQLCPNGVCIAPVQQFDISSKQLVYGR